jgi:hypothetical protein
LKAAFIFITTILFIACFSNWKSNACRIDKKNVQKDSITCIDIVTEIVTTSPLFLKITEGLYEKIIKNGGISFGTILEGSPNPKIDNALEYSKTYDFNLHETYKDHTPVIGRFTFNPLDKKLYEYDVAGDSLIQIEFDKTLLIKFNKLCN